MKMNKLISVALSVLIIICASYYYRCNGDSISNLPDITVKPLTAQYVIETINSSTTPEKKSNGTIDSEMTTTIPLTDSGIAQVISNITKNTSAN